MTTFCVVIHDGESGDVERDELAIRRIVAGFATEAAATAWGREHVNDFAPPEQECSDEYAVFPLYAPDGCYCGATALASYFKVRDRRDAHAPACPEYNLTDQSRGAFVS